MTQRVQTQSLCQRLNGSHPKHRRRQGAWSCRRVVRERLTASLTKGQLILRGSATSQNLMAPDCATVWPKSLGRVGRYPRNSTRRAYTAANRIQGVTGNSSMRKPTLRKFLFRIGNCFHSASAEADELRQGAKATVPPQSAPSRQEERNGIQPNSGLAPQFMR